MNIQQTLVSEQVGQAANLIGQREHCEEKYRGSEARRHLG
jgi:hypothetical protein